MRTDEDPEKLAKEIERDLLLPLRLRWLAQLTVIAAYIVAFWLVWVVYRGHGVMVAMLTFVLLAMARGFGPAPTLAAAATVLCFRFHVVGIWLPIVSYIVAAILLYASIRMERVRKMVNPL